VGPNDEGDVIVPGECRRLDRWQHATSRHWLPRAAPREAKQQPLTDAPSPPRNRGNIHLHTDRRLGYPWNIVLYPNMVTPSGEGSPGWDGYSVGIAHQYSGPNL
jgi:hypothetical protein